MATQQLHVENSHHTRGRAFRKWLIAGLLVLAGILVVIAVLLAVNWPFTRERVTRRLQEATATTVHMRGFHARYFPHPGCEAEDVVFQAHNGSARPLLSIRTLTVRTGFWELITKHVSLLRADGATIALPPFGSGQSLGGSNQGATVVDELVADGAVLDVLPKKAGGKPTRFFLRQFRLHGLGGNRALSFETVLDNPKPRGEITASGSFGPWKSGRAASTPVSGRYIFRQADLSTLGGIAGTLSSAGTFRGSFQHLKVEGTTDVPDFEASGNQHKFHLSTQFQANVNATNGDVVLESVAGLLGHTTIAAQGRIVAGGRNQGKSAALDFSVQDGRIEDILLLFVKAPRSPLMGATSFQAHINIPPGGQSFLRKVGLEGEFGVGGARFTSPKTEKSLTQLSLRARGETEKAENSEDPERVLSDLRGRVALKNGVATFTNLTFAVPGARAQMHGSYNLVNERIDLRGLLHVEAKLSHTTSGIKSFLLKALSPFLKSNHRGAVVPVSITGTYSHPSYHMSPQSKK